MAMDKKESESSRGGTIRLASDAKEMTAVIRGKEQRALAVAIVKCTLSDVEIIQAFLAAMQVRSPGTRIRVRFDRMPRPRTSAKASPP